MKQTDKARAFANAILESMPLLSQGQVDMIVGYMIELAIEVDRLNQELEVMARGMD